MNIAVYCASSPALIPSHEQAARDLGAYIGAHGHTLVYGGCKSGLMGTVADAALAAGAPVIGVVPDIPTIKQRQHEGLTEYRFVETLADRKNVMIELADAFVALPGGPGTIDEISDILSLIRLDLISSGCAFVNTEGFYQPMSDLLQNIVDAGYLPQEYRDRIFFSENVEEIGAFLEK